MLRGHQQIYAAFVGRTLLAEGYDVEFDIGATDSDASWDAEVFERLSGVATVPESRSAGNRWAHLMDRAAAYDTVFLVDADHYALDMAFIGARDQALPAHTVGIVTRTCEWCPGEAFYYEPRSLRRGARSAVRRLLRGTELEHLWLERIADGCVLDVALCKDERVVERKGVPFVWMPDITGSYAADDEPLNTERPVLDTVDTLSASERNRLLLFFGTGAWYKGYDYFLKLAVDDRDVIALHVGAPERQEAGKTMEFDVAGLRRRLLAEGRLLETGCFASEAASQMAFDRIRRFVSFHRLSGTSGTVIQAVLAGKPSLTPSGGLLGHRTHRYGYGRTYRALDDRSLLESWRAFVREDVSSFRSGIERFRTDFGADAIARVITSSMSATAA